MKPTLLVLAAGMGSRYGGLKQVDPVGPSGEIIIDYSIYDAIRAGFGKVVFVIRKDIEESFKESIGNRYEGKIEIDYAFQELDNLPSGFELPEERQKPWGTGHAILMAKDLINEPFAVINADDFYGQSGYQLIADYLRNAKDTEKADYCMVGYILRNTLSEFGTVSRGVCACTDDGYLIDVEELTKIKKTGDSAKNIEEGAERELTGNEIVSMNLWGFTPSIFKVLEDDFKLFLAENIDKPKSEFFIPSIVDKAIKNNLATTMVLECPERWFGITYREDKPEVVKSIQKLVDQGKYPEKLYGE
jgi:UTP-glucose-1-phosphate uridylyltransferase